VIEAMTDLASNHYANVHRGAYTLSLEATEVFEEARRRSPASSAQPRPTRS
jgi:selenocysteine lyase/cysteine desulfurase